MTFGSYIAGACNGDTPKMKLLSVWYLFDYLEIWLWHIIMGQSIGPLGSLQTKYEWFLVSGFIEVFLRIGQKLHKITNNCMKNRGSTTILTNLGVHPSNIHTKLEANPCCSSREEVKKVHADNNNNNNNDDGQRVIARCQTTDTGWSIESHSHIECD